MSPRLYTIAFLMLNPCEERRATVVHRVNKILKRFWAFLLASLQCSQSSSMSTRLISGHDALDKETQGGFLRGRMTEIVGPSLSGKSTLALHTVARNQQGEHNCVWIDGFNYLDPSYVRHLGIDLKRFAVLCPDSTLQAFDMAYMLLEQCAVRLIVFDDVYRLPLGGVSEKTSAASAIRQAAAKLARLAWRKQATVLFLSSYVDEHHSLRQPMMLRPWFETGYVSEVVELGARIRIGRRGSYSDARAG